MPRFPYLLIGFGFTWMALWAIFGSLLGAKINASFLSGDEAWLAGWSRMLMRTAHAHMNSMASVLVLLGLTFVPARRFASEKTLLRAGGGALAGTVVFGAGLVLEAFFPIRRGGLGFAPAITALGGIVYILAIGMWGMVFLSGTRRP